MKSKPVKQESRRSTEERPPRNVFVVMPFSQTPTRNEAQLTAFFEDRIKKPIEGAELFWHYKVRRSDETFNINEQIIRDLYFADVVIADLSGPQSNPNVMYELGMRLAFSNKPVILIREAHKDNRQIFDVAGFYAQAYDPLDYGPITQHILKKLKAFETTKEEYRSPVLEVLGEDYPLLAVLSRRRAAALLSALSSTFMGTLRLFAGHGTEFVEGKTSLKLGTDAIHFSKELLQHRDKLRKLPWSTLEFRPGPQPALEHCIAVRYLEGLFPDEIHESFAERLVEYHSRFLAGDPYWRSLTYERVLVFAAETSILWTMTRALEEALLSSTEADAERHFENFLQVQTTSLLSKDKSKGRRAPASKRPSTAGAKKARQAGRLA